MQGHNLKDIRVPSKAQMNDKRQGQMPTAESVLLTAKESPPPILAAGGEIIHFHGLLLV